MNERSSINMHTFHIPVMGTGFTIDTPVKVAKYGISSVISLVDDVLIEKMRSHYCKKLNIQYTPIDESVLDCRAKRITEYLNLIHEIVEKQWEELFITDINCFKEILDLLPYNSPIINKLKEFDGNYTNDSFIKWFKENVNYGDIDVNIMTKLDKENYKGFEKLPTEYNDAHAALRGFALSNLHSNVVLSAGMNPRLYNYIENFSDFFPDNNGKLKKGIILKVSDYRSSLIQGKYFAKKGLWISEFRIESGLNCGGHAFGTDGYLIGPILEDFKTKRQELHENIWSIYSETLKNKNIPIPSQALSFKITTQGGVTTGEEHKFLLDYYNLDSIGWATPFMLVPEVVNIDKNSLEILSRSKEKSIELSNISPLNIYFSNLKNNTRELEKFERIESGFPGSSCPRKYLAFNKEYDSRGLCTASEKYQSKKIKDLVKSNTNQDDYIEQYNKIVEKSCICVGLGTSALIVNGLDSRSEGPGVSLCPGPNIAFFSKIATLKEMINHIYDKNRLPLNENRLPMFVVELSLYINEYKDKLQSLHKDYCNKQISYCENYKQNILDGIEYYKNLFSSLNSYTDSLLNKLNDLENELISIKIS